MQLSCHVWDVFSSASLTTYLRALGVSLAEKVAACRFGLVQKGHSHLHVGRSVGDAVSIEHALPLKRR